jgi:mannose-1-phosphate guanylyltransferase
VFVQPQNHGTAIGMLFALAQVEERDPDANVVMLPADHHVAKEAVLSAALRRATDSLSHHPTGIVLLGIAPEEADPELGYIEPGRSDDGEIATVTRFAEKPNAAEAQALIARGALWNAFIIVARVQSLLQLFFPQHSALVARMRAAVRQPSCTSCISICRTSTSHGTSCRVEKPRFACCLCPLAAGLILAPCGASKRHSGSPQRASWNAVPFFAVRGI